VATGKNSGLTQRGAALAEEMPIEVKCGRKIPQRAASKACLENTSGRGSVKGLDGSVRWGRWDRLSADVCEFIIWLLGTSVTRIWLTVGVGTGKTNPGEQNREKRVPAERGQSSGKLK